MFHGLELEAICAVFHAASSLDALIRYKFHARHRGKFRKAQYRVTNWPAYNESLRRRGDLTIWVSDDVTQEWTAARRRTRGEQRKYSDIAIEICLTLRVLFRLALRRDAAWHGHKHGVKGTRKAWRKLHLALDPDSGVILASELTAEFVGDETALPDLFENIDAQVDRFVADGAYDGTGASDSLIAAFGSDVEIIIPPPKNAVPGVSSQRNRYIEQIAERGRKAWQVETDHNQRSRIETKMGRWKTVCHNCRQSRRTTFRLSCVRPATMRC